MIKGMLKGFVAAGLGLALTVSVAEAQKPAPEFGFQFIGFSLNNPDGDNNNTTNFGLGSGNVSVAFYLTEGIAIEPSLQYGMTSFEGGGDATSTMGLQVALPIYLAKEWGKGGGLFVAPHIGMNRFDPGAGDAVSQNHVGASVGTKLELSDNIFWRVQAGFDMGLESGDVGDPDYAAKYMNIVASFGMSVYLP